MVTPMSNKARTAPTKTLTTPYQPTYQGPCGEQAAANCTPCTTYAGAAVYLQQCGLPPAGTDTCYPPIVTSTILLGNKGAQDATATIHTTSAGTDPIYSYWYNAISGVSLVQAYYNVFRGRMPFTEIPNFTKWSGEGTAWHSRVETVLHYGFPMTCEIKGTGHTYQKDAPDAMYDDLTLSFSCSAPSSPGDPFAFFNGLCAIQGIWDNCLPRCNVGQIVSGNEPGRTVFSSSDNGRTVGNKCTTGGKLVGKFFWSGNGGANGYVTIG